MDLTTDQALRGHWTQLPGAWGLRGSPGSQVMSRNETGEGLWAATRAQWIQSQIRTQDPRSLQLARKHPSLCLPLPCHSKSSIEDVEE